MSVEQVGGFVTQHAHQPAGERGQRIDPRSAQGLRHRTERLARRSPRRGRCERKIPRLGLDAYAVVVGDDQCRGVARHEGKPAPALGPLHALEHDPGSVICQGVEEPDGCRDIGEQFRPDRHERPLRREGVELVSIGPDLQLRFHRSSSCRRSRVRKRKNPGHVPGAGRVVAAGRWVRRVSAPGSSSPSARPRSPQASSSSVHRAS